MNIDLKNITKVTREGVNKFNAVLTLPSGRTLTVTFSRVQHYWNVSLMVVVDGRAFHEYDGEFPAELAFAKDLWAKLDVKATEYEREVEALREAVKGSIFVALGGARLAPPGSNQ